MTTLYGITNCDTVKKARQWLHERGIEPAFHDYKRVGVDLAHLQLWCAVLGWSRVINTAGTTFRKLPQVDKTDLDEARAIQLMLAQPSLIKRPLLEHDGKLLLGFDSGLYAALLGTRD